MASPCPTEFRRPDGTIVHLARSEEREGAFYQTTAASCTCPNYRFRSHSDAGFRCKHMRDAFPIRCAHCRTNQVDFAGDICAWCAADLAALRAYCGCGRGGQRIAGFGVCLRCIGDQAERFARGEVLR